MQEIWSLCPRYQTYLVHVTGIDVPFFPGVGETHSKLTTYVRVIAIITPVLHVPFTTTPVSHQSWGSALLMIQSFSHSLLTAGSSLSPTTHLFSPLTTPTHNLPPASQFWDILLLGSPWHSPDRKNLLSSCQSVPSIFNFQPPIVIDLTESPLHASTTPQSPSQSATSPRGPQHGGKHKSKQYPQSVITFSNW